MISHYLHDDPSEYPFVSLETLAEDEMRRPMAASAYKPHYPSKFVDDEERMDRYVRDACAEGDKIRAICATRRILEDRSEAAQSNSVGKTQRDLLNAFRL